MVPQTPRMKALIIEDTKIVRMVTRKWLEQAGYEVEEATNGQEGLDAMTTGAYEIVTCDVDMPVMDGLECITQLREHEKAHGRPRQFVLCVTDDNNDDEQLLEAGMDTIFRKPLDKPSFDAMLRRLDAGSMELA